MIRQDVPPPVSVVIRTKNERRWIRHCLEMVYRQELAPIEVILVDNGSDDGTVEVARQLGVQTVLTIQDYSPGRALNLGAAKSAGEYIVFLSAHCVPVRTDWLQNLIDPFVDQDVAGVYGRQVPFEFSSPSDKRDLHLAFGPESVRQVKNPFFHNANSAVRRSVWAEMPFDEDLTNIEDWMWGNEVIEKGLALFYSADAEVFHHNGLHRSADPVRERNSVRIIESQNSVAGSASPSIPESLRLENRKTIALVPFSSENTTEHQFTRELETTIEELRHSKYAMEIFLVGDIALRDVYTNEKFIDRASIPGVEEMSIDELCSTVAKTLLKGDIQADFIIYANWRAAERPRGIVDMLLESANRGGFDTVFPGVETYAHLWFQDSSEEFVRINTPLVFRDRKSPSYLAKYGWGTVVEASVMADQGFPSGRIGIVGIPDR